jgi:pyruvate/2-oxoglutarate dehydrogenase complex dihydrolipoamide acyltransferase (E2) component
VVALALFLVIPAAMALAQAPIEITPFTSITPSSHITSWIYQMAIASLILTVLVLIGFTVSYLRFAPKFSGKEGKMPPAPPGSRPARLVSQAAAVRWTPPAAPAGSHAGTASAPAGRATATAVAERPAPAPPAQPAVAAAATEGAAVAAEASATPTAGPSGEPAVQADAVGAAEAAAPEPRPSAKAPEEVGAPADQAKPAPAATAAPSSAMDQETFDRVLEEQLAKGMDRRVAEGRARAAAVVAARKKAQG